MPTIPASELWLTPSPFAKAGSLLEGRLLLTPNPRASHSLGLPPVSLLRMAQKILVGSPETQIDPLSEAQLLVAVSQQLGYPDPHGAARRFTPILSEMIRAGVDLAALEAFPDPRVQEVARFARIYRQRLRGQTRFDPAETLWMAANRVSIRRPILVAGYQHLGRDEEQFVLSLAAPGSALVLPFDDGDSNADNLEVARRFEIAGWTIHREASGEPERPLAIQGWQFVDQEAEVRGVLAQVKALLTDGASPADVAVVARDDAAYGPLVLAIAQEQGIPVCAEYQIPLARTRFGHWLGLLAEVVETDLPFESTFRLLSHPLSGLLSGKERTKARQTHPAGFEAWSALCPATAELPWPESDSPGDWVDRLRKVIRACGIARRARPWASEVIAIGRLERALGQLAANPSAQLSRQDFLEELREAIAILATPAHPARGGVSLHTPLALFGARVKHLFVVGAAEDQLPARLNDDPVLDFTTRKRLSEAGFPLETAAAAARRERLTFNALLAVAEKSLTFAYSRVAAGKARLPSPAYLWLGLTPVTPEVPVASIEEGRRIKIFQPVDDTDPVLSRAHGALTVERRGEAPSSISVPDSHDGHTGVPVLWRDRTFSASQLGILGQCAFKWYAQRVLRVKEPEEASDDLANDARGRLYHKTLELAGRQAKGLPDLRQAVLEVLETSMLEAELLLSPELGYRFSDLPAWEVRRGEHLAVLRRAVQHEGFSDPGALLEATECEFRGDWREFTLKGVVDRIDRVDGALVIIDYKGGSSIYGKAQDSSRKATLDLQLPIYAETAAPCLFPGIPVGAAFYYTLSKPKRHDAKVDPAELEGLAARLKGYLEGGHFPVAPDLKCSACTYCDQVLVCRAGTRLGRKEA